MSFDLAGALLGRPEVDLGGLEAQSLPASTTTRIQHRPLDRGRRISWPTAMSFRATIDATAEGVHSSNIQRIFFEDESVVVVLRPRISLDDETIRKITDFARAATGTEYSKREAIAVVARTMRSVRSRKQFCSRLAAQAYAFAGIDLVPDADFCSPEDLRRSALWEVIVHYAEQVGRPRKELT
jgi:hypothetical protein